jgi:hypothetical protein
MMWVEFSLHDRHMQGLYLSVGGRDLKAIFQSPNSCISCHSIGTFVQDVGLDVKRYVVWSEGNVIVHIGLFVV